MCFRETLSWIKRKNISYSSIELDCQILIHALDLFYFGMVVNDCKSILFSMPDMANSFIKRSTNAHTIAKVVVYGLEWGMPS